MRGGKKEKQDCLSTALSLFLEGWMLMRQKSERERVRSHIRIGGRGEKMKVVRALCWVLRVTGAWWGERQGRCGSSV